MKYRKIILILLGLLLFLVLWFFTVNCYNRKPIEISVLSDKVTTSKYGFIIIQNSRLVDDEKFRALVRKQVEGTSYLRICYEEAVRLHKTYFVRAWVFYEKE